MNPNHQSWIKRNFPTIVFFLIFLNILLLDLFAAINLMDKKNKYSSQSRAVSISITPTPIFPSADESQSQNCSPNCVSEIDRALAPLKKALSATPRLAKTQTGTLPTTAPVVQPTESSQHQATVKEFFIPLGTGSSTAADWTDVPGVKAEIDSTKYANIQKVLFEASTHVPSANQIVEVRLYNETDKYVVSNSEFLYPSGTTQNFRIAAIQLGQGAKTYQVQMKTQLQYSAVLDQSRIHITTN